MAGNFLAFQWIELGVFTAGAWVQSLVGKGNSAHGRRDEGMTDFTQKDPEARECVFHPNPTAGSPEHTVGGEHESAQEGVTEG